MIIIALPFDYKQLNFHLKANHYILNLMELMLRIAISAIVSSIFSIAGISPDSNLFIYCNQTKSLLSIKKVKKLNSQKNPNATYKKENK